MSFNSSIAITHGPERDLFFSDETAVVKCAVGGCNLMPTQIRECVGQSFGIAVVVDSQGLCTSPIPGIGQAVMLIAKWP